jgi:alanine dehydrogenase
LPKVQSEDLAELRAGQIMWGWPHCVQDPVITEIAIDSRLTLIAFEAMNHWQSNGGFGLLLRPAITAVLERQDRGIVL